MKKYAISKTLSANDVGDTGAHQAGIHVPKSHDILSFFPDLDHSTKNPRHLLEFRDDSGTVWEFAFIYYNNKYFGGTRNEYRLTRMTPFIREHGLAAGDKLCLERSDSGRLHVRYERKRSGLTRDGALRLGSNWKVINI
ncbi:EcoRII N-terminal effector-binding domain-containing protein [Pseudomonadota bacterium]